MSISLVVADIRQVLELSNAEKVPAPGRILDDEAFTAVHADRMTIKLTHKIEELERERSKLQESEKRHRTILNTAMDGFWLTDKQGRILEVNEAYCRMSGYREEELLTMRIPDLEAVEAADDVAEHNKNIAAQREERFETRHRRKNGTIYDIEISVQRIPVQGGLFVAFMRDITNRKQAEDKLKVQTQQLGNANKELESFSYSVSHDLRAPLRAINGFSRMLARDIKGKVDPEAIHKLATIRENGLKMNRLIDDVLSFSKLTRETMTMKVIDMDDLANDVWNELQENSPQQNISLTVAHPMTCYGDRQMMRRVLTNLLSNAVKFTKERQAAMIEVGSYEEEHEYVYFVKDNGCGFDMQHSGKLFQLFQRLHSEADYEGTGAGLSIVKRIVERHGGRIWADSKVNEGATFYFTLPKKITLADDSAQ